MLCVRKRAKQSACPEKNICSNTASAGGANGWLLMVGEKRDTSLRLQRAAFTRLAHVVVVVVGLVLPAVSGYAAIPMPPILLDQLKVVAVVTFTAPPDFKPIAYAVTSYHWGTSAEIFDFQRQGARTVAYWDFEKEKVQYWRTGLDQRLSALATSDEIYPILALFTPYGVCASELAAMHRNPDPWKYEMGVAPGEQAWQRFILDRVQLPAEAGQEQRTIEFQSKRRIVFREGKLVEVLGTLYTSEAKFRVTYADHDEKTRFPRRAVAELKGPGGSRSPLHATRSWFSPLSGFPTNVPSK